MTKKSLPKKQTGGSTYKKSNSKMVKPEDRSTPAKRDAVGSGTKASQRNMLHTSSEREVFPIGGRPKEKSFKTSLKSKTK